MAWPRAAGGNEVDGALLEAYAAETSRLVRQRLAVVAPLFVVLMGSGVVFEMMSRPERRGRVLMAWVAESSVVVIATVLSRLRAFERRSSVLSAIIIAGV